MITRMMPRPEPDAEVASRFPVEVLGLLRECCAYLVCTYDVLALFLHAAVPTRSDAGVLCLPSLHL